MALSKWAQRKSYHSALNHFQKLKGTRYLDYKIKQNEATTTGNESSCGFKLVYAPDFPYYFRHEGYAKQPKQLLSLNMRFHFLHFIYLVSMLK